MRTQKEESVGNVNKVLSAMQPMCIYRPCDLTELTRLTKDEVRRCLKALARGMMVDVIETSEYRRKAMYQTKQEKLF